MNKVIQFGENVEGYSIPVLNEREIRAAAGMLFLLMFTSVMTVILTENFLLLKYAVTIFLVDILIRVFVSPRYAPTLILGRLIVRNQVPEYVGAQQKKFAWVFGTILAAIFFSLTVVVNSYSPISGIICFICLIFLFFEAAFGICLGCKFYSLFYKEKAQYCLVRFVRRDPNRTSRKHPWVKFLLYSGLLHLFILLPFRLMTIFVRNPLTC